MDLDLFNLLNDVIRSLLDFTKQDFYWLKIGC